jgi:hypothetical protein
MRRLRGVSNGDQHAERRLLVGAKAAQRDRRRVDALEPRVDDLRMHVALAAHGGRVAQRRRGGADRLAHRGLGRALRRRALELAQVAGGAHGPSPGAEVLARERTARDRAQVVVHVGADTMRGPSSCSYWNRLKPGRSRQRRTTRATAGSSTSGWWRLPDLPEEVEAHARPSCPHVASAKRRDAERAVLAPVFLAADAHERLVHHLDDGGEHALLGRPGSAEVAAHRAPDARERARDLDQRLELVRAAIGRPVGVVAVLLAPTLVVTGRLEVAVRVRADPHARPGRRQDQRRDALEGLAVAHRPPVRVAIGEALPARDARDAGCRVVDVAEPGGRGGSARGGVGDHEPRR